MNNITLKNLKETDLYKNIPSKDKEGNKLNKSKLNKQDLINLMEIYKREIEKISIEPILNSEDTSPNKTSRICLKVKELRKNNYDNLREWLNQPNNIYVGRYGRIFINKEIFNYQGHPLANPYKVGPGKYSLEDSLKLYKKWIEKNIKEDSVKYFQILRNLKGKNLGCYCEKENKCHADIIIEMIDKYTSSC